LTTQPPKSRTTDEAILWIVIGLFLALSLTYIAYPAFYYQRHPTPRFPIRPVASSIWSKPYLAYFFDAAVTALFGFWQTRISRRVGLESSRILLWLFLFSSLVVTAGSWKYGLAIHFWTLATKEELPATFPALQTAGTLVKWSLISSVALVLLNFGYALFDKQQHN
jgi:hypothetical protein